MRTLARISLVLAAFAVTACGFTPLYEAGGSSREMRAELASVEVAPIADRLGQVMRNRLTERLSAGDHPAYRLEVTLTQDTEVYGFRPDAAATQEQLTVTAHVVFVSLKDGKKLFEDNLRERTAYDLVLSDFATVQQREDSAKRLALELAERIHRRLALYFSKG